MARAVLGLLAALVVALRTSVAAGEADPSDPVQLGIMQSYPLLPTNKQVLLLSNWLEFPFNR